MVYKLDLRSGYVGVRRILAAIYFKIVQIMNICVLKGTLLFSEAHNTPCIFDDLRLFQRRSTYCKELLLRNITFGKTTSLKQYPLHLQKQRSVINYKYYNINFFFIFNLNL